MSTHLPRSIRLPALAAFVLAIPLAAACTGGADTQEVAEVPCTIRADSLIGEALEVFIASRDPLALRFLTPVSTDSVVPDPARYPLQAKGRLLYLWPKDPATQADFRKQLIAMGKFTTLVVSYHGQQPMDDGRTAVEFSGTYIDPQNDGIVVPRTKVYFECKAEDPAQRFTLAPTPADS